MSVDLTEAKRIAALAHLRFDEDELRHLTAELNQILAHVETLRALAGGDRPVEGSAAAGGASTRALEGAPDEMTIAIASVAPRWEGGFFVVPPPPGVHEDASQ